jgi:hypothetical protein
MKRVCLRVLFLALLMALPAHHLSGQQPALALELSLITEVDGYRVEFGRIGAVVADEQGRMFVADVHEIGQVIAVLDPRGNRIGTFGGRGEGPGEFTYLASTLGWMGDTLVAMDHRYNQTKVKFFDAEGRVVHTSTLGTEPGLSVTRPQVLSAGPEMFVLRFLFTPGGIRGRDEPAELIWPEARYGKLGRDGSFLSLPTLSEAGSETGAGATRGMVLCQSVDRMWLSGFSPPFTDRGPLRAFTPAGELARGHSDSLYIEIVDPESGAVTRSFSHETRPIPLTDAAWESVPEIREIRQHEEEIFNSKVEAAGPPGNPCPVLEMRPEFHPVMRTLLVDEQGRFWVELTTREGFVLAGFDETGRFLGQAPMPDRDPRVNPYIRDNRLYVVTVDEMEVQGLLVYEIRGSGTGDEGSTY